MLHDAIHTIMKFAALAPYNKIPGYINSIDIFFNFG